MQLTDEQKQKVSAWIAEGLKLSDIQVRLADEFGLRLTYMDVRFIVDDLKLMPKDPPAPEKPAEPASPAPGAMPAPVSQPAQSAPSSLLAEPGAPAGKVAVTVDEIARPGAIASGKVTFSDGKKAEWYLDQTGRLGVVAQEQGYRPPQADVETFQQQLDHELAKMGY